MSASMALPPGRGADSGWGLTLRAGNANDALDADDDGVRGVIGRCANLNTSDAEATGFYSYPFNPHSVAALRLRLGISR